MTKPTLLFLTDLTNGAEAEDILISDFLRRDFDVLIMHPSCCESFEDRVDAIIIRNTWNENDYGASEPWYGRWRAKPWLPIHDDMYVRSTYYDDTYGWKGYLFVLYKKGYPVIPSVDSIKDIGQLPETEEYFIKPQDGFSAINARKISKKELIELDPDHYIIEPFIDFEYEISFYYLDKQLQYVLYAPDKQKRWTMEKFDPSESDIAFAQKFIEWEPQTHGIVRVDACRTKAGDLLLTEITDQGGISLSITCVPEAPRLAFLENLSRSLQNRIKKVSI